MIKRVAVLLDRVNKQRRSMRVHWIATGATGIALLAVLGALPGRQEGSRNATDAYIPLRAMTAAEAAFLLTHMDASFTDTVIVRSDGEDLLLATTRYVLPENGPQTGSSGRFHKESATWENFSSVYRVPRRALEQSLGRPVREAEFVPDFVAKHPVSFSPERVPLYIFVESAFIAIWLTLLGWWLARVRRLTAVLPVLVLFLAAPMLFVRIYSPAFTDADWFHQRVVVEQLDLYAAPIGFVLLLPALASAILWVLLRCSEWLAGNRGASAQIYRRRLLSTLAIAALVFLCARTARHAWHLRTCASSLEIVSMRVKETNWLDPIRTAAPRLPLGQDISKIQAESDVRIAIARVLSSTGEDPRIVLELLVPHVGPQGELLFLWRSDSYYADLRSTEIELETYTARSEGGCGRELSIQGRPVVLAVGLPMAQPVFGIRWW